MKPNDTQLLDWLESQRTGYGDGVVVRQSVRGRGLRIHETSGAWDVQPQPTIREAIIDAMLRDLATREGGAA